MTPTFEQLTLSGRDYLPVAIKHRTKGHAYFVAAIYKIPKPNGKGHEWWIVELDTQTVKRMDTY